MDICMKLKIYKERGAVNMIRLANRSDLVNVNKLRKQVHEVHAKGRPDIFREEFNKELENHIYSIFDNEDGQVIVVEKNNMICGFATVEIVEKPESPYNKARSFFHVIEFGIDENHRREGLGRALFEFIKKMAKEKGIENIELDMWEFNEGALKFYESLGFKTYRRYLEAKLK